MWHGEYKFFDYKGNIAGYNGQDYMSPIQYIMTAIGVVGIVLLLFFLRNTKKETSKKILWIMGIVFITLYIIKTSWESYWDIKTGQGFNIWILPFDTCSIFMPALLVAGLAKKDSFVERVAAVWLATIGFAGGLANFIFLRGLNYYPMFTFGALYSFFWHIAMVFVAFYIPVTKFHKFNWWDILISMIPMGLFGLFVIPFNYIKGLDFMLLNGAGGVPLIEGLAEKLINAHLRVFATLLMLVAYIAASTLMVSIYIGVNKLFVFMKNQRKRVNNLQENDS